MAEQYLHTYRDTVDALLRLEGVSVDQTRLAQAKSAVLGAMMDVFGNKQWSYFLTRIRITTDDDYSEGTVAYDHTGGANERQLTLTGGVWPANAARGWVLIDGVEHEVESRVSDTVASLSVNHNPGADLAAGTSYLWWRDTYPLPIGVQQCGQLIDHDEGFHIEYLTAGDLLARRSNRQQASFPQWFTFLGSLDFVGGMSVQFEPPPDDVYQFEGIARRLPQPLRTFDYWTGTVEVSEGTKAVTGTGTAWTDRMAGAVIRFGTTSNVPEGLEGQYPYVEQRIVASVESATALTLDEVVADAHAAVKYRISDYVDLEPGAMLSAFQRCAEYRFALALSRKDWPQRKADYEQALRSAREMDSRYMGSRQPDHVVYNRLRVGPVGEDVGA